VGDLSLGPYPPFQYIPLTSTEIQYQIFRDKTYLNITIATSCEPLSVGDFHKVDWNLERLDGAWQTKEDDKYQKQL